MFQNQKEQRSEIDLFPPQIRYTYEQPMYAQKEVFKITND